VGVSPGDDRNALTILQSFSWEKRIAVLRRGGQDNSSNTAAYFSMGSPVDPVADEMGKVEKMKPLSALSATAAPRYIPSIVLDARAVPLGFPGTPMILANSFNGVLGVRRKEIFHPSVIAAELR
jgi:hypothetical protein